MVYLAERKKEFVGVLGSHVDNVLFLDSTMFHRDVIKTVRKNFKNTAEAPVQNILDSL